MPDHRDKICTGLIVSPPIPLSAIILLRFLREFPDGDLPMAIAYQHDPKLAQQLVLDELFDL